MKLRITESVDRIRAFAKANGMNKHSLAKEAGIVHTTLRDFDEEDWNPTRKTLERLEGIIPDNISVRVRPDVQ